MNILAPHVEGALFIDLFSGSGAMACEALSRGARGAVLVEKDKKALQALRRNVEECCRRCQKDGRTVSPLKVLGHETEVALRSLRKSLRADIVWADPPYCDSVAWLAGPQGVALSDMVAEGGLFVMELARQDAEALCFPESIRGVWEKVKVKNYGESAIVVWQKLGQKG